MQTDEDPRVPTPRAFVLRTPVRVVTCAELLSQIDVVVRRRDPTVFVGLYASQFRMLARDDRYHKLVAGSVTYPDGQGVVSELHKRGIADAERLATTDVVHPIARLAAQQAWRVGFYGAASGVADRAARALTSMASGLEVVAVWDGYSGGPQQQELEELNLAVLFVGLGAPKQELWAYGVGTAAGVPALLTCGGLFDFLAGDKRRAPRWLQRAGLEWAFRVLLEPRRLIGRYVVGNAYFIWHARRERARARAWVR
jgi:N-acetylglucosaminyldiphosphoundecaprenol N-acetyl-beta-D-mannosaminyltransferase